MDMMLLLAQLQHGDADERKRALEELGQLGDTAALPAIIEALNDEDDDVCVTAAWALGCLEDARAIEPLRTLLTHDEWRRQSAAAAALDILGDPRGIAFMKAALTVDDPEFRIMVVEELDHSFFTEAGMDLQVRIMLHETDSDLRVRAAGHLAAEGYIGAVKPFLTILHCDDQELKAYAEENESWMWGGTSYAELLLEALEEYPAAEQTSAIRALSQMLEPRAVEPIFARLDAEDSRVRAAAIEAIGVMRIRRAFPAVSAAVHDADNRVRAAVKEALSHLATVPEFQYKFIKPTDRHTPPSEYDPRNPDSWPIEEITKKLHDEEDPLDQLYCARALGRKGLSYPIEPFARCLQATQVFHAEEAVESLVELQDWRGIPHMIEALTHYRVDVREYTGTALIALTEQDFGWDQAAWQAWWGTAGAAMQRSKR